jgi:hypothetical protein
MRKVQLLFILVFLVFVQIPSLNAQTVDDSFNRANEYYRAGKYPEAVKEYENLITKGYRSSAIYYNLGNAYYRNEQLGSAILSFERAAVLNPGDPDVEHNLKLTYLKTVDRIEPVPDLFFIQWMRAAGSVVAPEAVWFIFALSWILLFVSLSVMYLFMRPEIIRTARIILLISFITVVICGMMMGIQSFRETASDRAIVTENIVTAKSSPDINSVDAFVIHEGLKVRLSDSVGGWVKISLPDGKVGWILAHQCERI